jgi:hypothetical protein
MKRQHVDAVMLLTSRLSCLAVILWATVRVRSRAAGTVPPAYASWALTFGLCLHAAFIAALVLRQRSAAVRRAQGRCIAYGYDLRGTPGSESKTCPECGAACSSETSGREADPV